MVGSHVPHAPSSRLARSSSDGQAQASGPQGNSPPAGNSPRGTLLQPQGGSAQPQGGSLQPQSGLPHGSNPQAGSPPTTGGLLQSSGGAPAGGLPQGARLFVVANGQGSPCLDLRRIPDELADAAVRLAVMQYGVLTLPAAAWWRPAAGRIAVLGGQEQGSRA
jgi:type II pantothenate kinase